MTLKIDMLGGNCPVQAEGTIDGKPFYFRARGQSWSFGVGDDPVCNPDFYVGAKWCEDKFGAGWMDEDEARKLIDQCAELYYRNHEAFKEGS